MSSLLSNNLSPLTTNKDAKHMVVGTLGKSGRSISTKFQLRGFLPVPAVIQTVDAT